MILTAIVPEYHIRSLYQRVRGCDHRHIAEFAMDREGFPTAELLDYKVFHNERSMQYEVELNIRTEAEKRALANDDFIISRKEAGMLFRYLSTHGCEWEDSDAWIALYERLKQCAT